MASPALWGRFWRRWLHAERSGSCEQKAPVAQAGTSNLVATARCYGDNPVSEQPALTLTTI